MLGLNILAADVAGYSRLMGADEEGTLARLKAHRRNLIDPMIAEHRGRVVKTTGDGILIEFPSVVDAVRCAVDVQRAMAEHNTAETPENRIEFRVGINLGDIIIDGEDIYGDGVNIAARLEALADPGGIYISQTVLDHARGKVPFDVEDQGEHMLKNIAQPCMSIGSSSVARADSGPRPKRAPLLLHRLRGRRSPCFRSRKSENPSRSTSSMV